MRSHLRLLVLGGCLIAAICSNGPPAAAQSKDHDKVPGRDTAEIVAEPEIPGLHNVLRVSDRIYSGSEPHGDEGFASLARLGIKTVVSVDGARPDIERAHARGMRYVHIPIGYDGVSVKAGNLLARVPRESEAPIYVHCHHGQHRGPAAAAVICVAGGRMTGKDALRILEKAGTGKNYSGLWRDVENSTAPAGKTDAGPPLVEVAEVESFAAAMARIDRHFDILKLCETSGWRTPHEHPDVSPSQEALILKEGFREARRTLAGNRDERFVRWLSDIEAQANSLETALRSGQVDNAGKQFKRLDASCKQCHAAYRNNPQPATERK